MFNLHIYLINMERFCEFRLHEYMDMHPTKKVRTFIGNDEEDIAAKAAKYAQYMTKTYSGGPTTFIKVMSSKEAKSHIADLVAYEKSHWQIDSQEFIDNINNLYSKCYEEI